MSKVGIIFLVVLNLSLALSSVIEISLPDSKSTGPSGITCAESGVCAGKPDGTLFADPNGNGYIVCQCECGIERPCPEGTKFNEQLLACDHIPATPSPATPSPATPSPATPSPATPSPATPSPATPSPATPKPPTSGSTGTPSSTGPSGITCAESGVCAGKPDGTLFADPKSNGYIVCQCECAIERPCPEGTKFDAQLLTCDHIPATPSPATPSPATPSPATPKPPTPSPATPSPATPSPATTSPATPSPATPKPPTSGSTGTPSSTGPSGITCAESGVCAGKPDGTLFADPNSNGYIVCQCECAIERPCPEGTKFDAQLLTCDHIAGTPVIPSTPSPVTPSPVTPSPVTPSPVTPSPVTPSPVTPSPVTPSPVTPSPVTPSPVTPSPVTPSPVTPSPVTPSPATPSPATPSPATPSPVTPSPATPSPATPAPGPSGNETIITCPNNVQLCKDQEEGTLFPVDGVCNKFYKCNYGCAIEIPCPYNLVYNPTQEYCDYPQNYKCPWPYTPPSGPSAGPSGIACPSGGRCVGQEEGTLFPSLTSCSKYVICQCECEVELNCSQGLVWDQKLLTCNYPENVQCKI